MGSGESTHAPAVPRGLEMLENQRIVCNVRLLFTFTFIKNKVARLAQRIESKKKHFEKQFSFKLRPTRATARGLLMYHYGRKYKHFSYIKLEYY